MNRRALLKAFVIGPAAITPRHPAPRFGFLDVMGHRAHLAATGEFLHTTINGVDVTDRCSIADDVAGYVEVFCRDRATHHWDVQQGAYHVRGGGACRHRITGDVRIQPGPRP